MTPDLMREPMQVSPRFRSTIEAGILELERNAARDERAFAELTNPDHRRCHRCWSKNSSIRPSGCARCWSRSAPVAAGRGNACLMEPFSRPVPDLAPMKTKIALAVVGLGGSLLTPRRWRRTPITRGRRPIPLPASRRLTLKQSDAGARDLPRGVPRDPHPCGSGGEEAERLPPGREPDRRPGPVC